MPTRVAEHWANHCKITPVEVGATWPEQHPKAKESHIRILDAPPTPRTGEGQRDVSKPTTFVFFVIRGFPHSQRSSKIGTMLLPSFVSE